ncbi:hypothetical protein MMC12_003126 [Toensbergia leucococca]|nr:hypothetical protein [Toensbergia leucococca]
MSPSIRYYNQTAPFWDFVANLESTAGDHPFFNAYGPRTREADQTDHQGPPGGEGPPPPPEPHHPGSPPPPPEPHHPSGPPPPPGHHHSGGSPHRHDHSGGSPHRREGPPGCGWGRHNRGGPWRGGFGGPGHRGRGGFPFGGPASFDMNSVAQFLSSQFGIDPSNLSGESKENKKDGAASKDFTPPCDVFDTEDAYIIHLSLPGARKEDVGVNWDADKSELSVGGVIYRPGDEDFLKTLAMDEREIGVFEKKIRLGSRASPANVEIDSIAAKMEDGVLMVTVPKVDREYVEIKKVDIE